MLGTIAGGDQHERHQDSLRFNPYCESRLARATLNFSVVCFPRWRGHIAIIESSLHRTTIQCCLGSGQALVHQNLDFDATVFSSPLRRLVGRRGISRTHCSGCDHVPYRNLAALD
jgi:hypothetical protein